jgi:hypothetical protein
MPQALGEISADVPLFRASFAGASAAKKADT